MFHFWIPPRIVFYLYKVTFHLNFIEPPKGEKKGTLARPKASSTGRELEEEEESGFPLLFPSASMLGLPVAETNSDELQVSLSGKRTRRRVD